MGIPYPTANGGRMAPSLLIIIPPPAQSFQPVPPSNIRPLYRTTRGAASIGVPNIRPLPRGGNFARGLRNPLATFLGHHSFDDLAGLLRLGKGAYWGISASCATRHGYLYQNAYQCTTVVPYQGLNGPLRSSTWAVGKIVVPTTAFNKGNNFRYTDRFQHALGSNRTPRPMPNEAFSDMRPVFDPLWDIAPGRWYNTPLPVRSPAKHPRGERAPERTVGGLKLPELDTDWKKEFEQWPDRKTLGKPNPPQPPFLGNPFKPPGKEKKLWTKVALAVVSRVFNAVTEIGDFLEALFDALPGEVQRLYERNTAGFARAVWDHWEEIDFAKAFVNVVKNQIEDAIIGALHRRPAGQSGSFYFAGSNSVYSSREEWEFEQAVWEALRQDGYRVYHTGTSVVGSYDSRRRNFERDYRALR